MKFTFEFYVALQFFVNGVLLFLLFCILRNSRKKIEESLSEGFYLNLKKKMEQIFRPVLEDSRSTAALFESQVKEKKKIIKNLNNKLDDKIISINLILKRAKSYLQKEENFKKDKTIEPDVLYNQQENIFTLHKQGKSSKEISEKLNIALGEVDLIIGLKKKLLKL